MSTRPESAGDLARRTTIGTGVAVVAVLVTTVLVDAVGVTTGGSGAMNPFAAGPLVASTIVAGIGAAVTYAVLLGRSSRPTRWFVRVAVTVFLVMLLPVAVVSPTLGVTTAGQFVLAAYHALVAVPIVAALIGRLG